MKKENKKTLMSRISAAVLILMLGLTLTGCGSEEKDSGSSNKGTESTGKSVVTKTFEEVKKEDEDFVAQYKGKTVTITEVPVLMTEDGKDFYLGSLMRYVDCPNTSSLGLTKEDDGKKVTVVGQVSETSKSTYPLRMTSCTIQK